MTIAAAMLKADDVLTPGDLARILADENARIDRLSFSDNKAVRIAFNASYSRLTKDDARVFRLLSLSPGPEFSVHLIAATAGLCVASAHVILTRLRAANLVMQGATRGRYRLHDLLRIYAQDCLIKEDTNSEISEAIRRIVDWYLYTARNGDRMLRISANIDLPKLSACVTPVEFTAADQALAWCEDERKNLVEATRMAFEARLLEHAWTLPAYMSAGILYLGKHWDDWLTVDRIGLSAARQLGNKYAEVRALLSLGILHAEMGDRQEGIKYFLEANRVNASSDARYNVIEIMNLLGNAYSVSGEPEKAETLLKAALLKAIEDRDLIYESTLLLNLGEHYGRVERYRKSIAYLKHSIRLLKEFGPAMSASVAVALADLGTAYFKLNEIEQAEKYWKTSLALSREIGNVMAEAFALKGLGEICKDRGELTTARSYWQRAVEILARIDRADAEELRADLADLDEVD